MLLGKMVWQGPGLASLLKQPNMYKEKTDEAMMLRTLGFIQGRTVTPEGQETNEQVLRPAPACRPPGLRSLKPAKSLSWGDRDESPKTTPRRPELAQHRVRKQKAQGSAGVAPGPSTRTDQPMCLRNQEARKKAIRKN